MKTNNSKSCVCGGCKLVGTIVGIIVGVIIGILFSLGNIPFIVTAIWIAFGLAALVLLYILGTVFFGSCSGSCGLLMGCLRQKLGCLLTGSIGTIITSLAALSIVLNIAFNSVIILVGLVAFFFTFLIVAVISFIKCTVNFD